MRREPCLRKLYKNGTCQFRRCRFVFWVIMLCWIKWMTDIPVPFLNRVQKYASEKWKRSANFPRDCMPCKRSPERYRNTPPTRKCGDRLNIALIRSIHQKGSQLHPASRNHAPPTRQFYHPIFKCVNGFCSERRSFTRKVFSDSLLSAILILHIKVALFIFPKSIDKEVFSTMPMYYRCFLSMNQPHDP